jgi:hypothetical protein
MKILLTLLFIVLFSSTHTKEYSPLPDAVYVSDNSKEEVPFDLDYLKLLWKKKRWQSFETF